MLASSVVLVSSTMIFLVKTLPSAYDHAITKKPKQPYSAHGLSPKVRLGHIMVNNPAMPMSTPAARRQVKRSTPLSKIAPARKDHIGTVPLKMPPIVGATKRWLHERAAKGSKINSKPMTHGRQICLSEMRKSLRCTPYKMMKNSNPANTRKKVFQYGGSTSTVFLVAKKAVPQHKAKQNANK